MSRHGSAFWIVVLAALLGAIMFIAVIWSVGTIDQWAQTVDDDVAVEHLVDEGYVVENEDGDLSVDADVIIAALEDIDTSTGEDVDGYAVDEFGPAWKDTDHNGCDQRNDVLTRDMEDGSITYRDGTDGCVVETGTLHDVYTGDTIDFSKAENANAVEIDHLVARHWAWNNGASTWSDKKRLKFATDFDNLQAVDGPTNGSKSDLGPSEWLPDDDYTCTYLARFTYVVHQYDLGLPDPDRQAIKEGVEKCSH